MGDDGATQQIYIGRQPILNRGHQLHAYELLFRSGQINAASVDNNLGATASVISHAFTEFGIEEALGPYRGFINCDEDILRSDLIELLPASKIVLEILETVEVTPEIVERCQDLKARGFTLALDDFADYEDKFQPLLDIIEVVKIDLTLLEPEALLDTLKALKRWPVSLLAEKVDSREQAQHCHDLGFSLFQGYYFARPAIMAGKKLGHSELALIRLLGLVMEDADTAALEAVLKHEPGLTMNLMRLTNSVATGVRVKVTSLRHAITILGRRQLQRWLQLLLYTDRSGGGNVASPLLQLAATRGRLMELIALKLRPGNREFEDHAFMTGVMSLMPTLMSVPIDEILRSISVSDDIRGALESRNGVLGTMLQLAEALEASDGPACQSFVEQLGTIDHMAVNLCLTQALAWAGNIEQQNA